MAEIGFSLFRGEACLAAQIVNELLGPAVAETDHLIDGIFPALHRGGPAGGFPGSLGPDGVRHLVDQGDGILVGERALQKFRQPGGQQVLEFLVAQKIVEALGHSYEAIVVAPSCLEGGYSVYTCVCGDSYTADFTQATGHAWSEWILKNTVVEERSCKTCGEAETRNVANPFVDITASDYFYAPVLWAVGKGVTNGCSATEFAPNASCTRAQIVTFLWRSQGCPEPATINNPFVDVPVNSYYYFAVLWAVENGITNGMSEKLFAPDATCTRGQAVTFLYRAFGTPTESENPFTDVISTDYFCDAVLWAVENNITMGIGGGKFSPEATCTRAQIVTFLYRALT